MAALSIRKRKMDIQLKNLQRRPLNLPQIKIIVSAVLRCLDIKNASLSFVFVTSPQIKSLNKRFLHRSYETDVLSFDLGGGVSKVLIGEIIISVDMAVKNAKVFDNDLNHEIVLYIIHGILHLLGYDDHKPTDIKRMRVKEKEILQHLAGKINHILT